MLHTFYLALGGALVIHLLIYIDLARQHLCRGAYPEGPLLQSELLAFAEGLLGLLQTLCDTVFTTLARHKQNVGRLMLCSGLQHTCAVNAAGVVFTTLPRRALL